jgi:hypothetical protein
VTPEQYAVQIRGWACFDREMRLHRGQEPLPRDMVFTFSRVAALWERTRFDIHTKGASPGDRARLEELNARLQGLATELGLGTVDPDELLPGDPSRLFIVDHKGTPPNWWDESPFRDDKR